MAIDPDVAQAAQDLLDMNVDPARKAEAENLILMKTGAMPTTAELSSMAVGGDAPSALGAGAGAVGGGVGGDGLSPDSVEAMYDRQMAGRGSTVTNEDIKRAEMHARHGNSEAARNVGAGAGGLEETIDRAEFNQKAGADYMMNARPGESVDDFEKRQEEQQEKGPGLGQRAMETLMAGLAVFGLGQTATQQAAEAGMTMQNAGVEFAGEVPLAELADLVPSQTIARQQVRGAGMGLA